MSPEAETRRHMAVAHAAAQTAAERIQWANSAHGSDVAHWAESAGWWYQHAMANYDIAESWRRVS
ncbi:MAG: hypothetical protein V3W41_22285 [Planctomycetota bacterium]